MDSDYSLSSLFSFSWSSTNERLPMTRGSRRTSWVHPNSDDEVDDDTVAATDDDSTTKSSSTTSTATATQTHGISAEATKSMTSTTKEKDDDVTEETASKPSTNTTIVANATATNSTKTSTSSSKSNSTTTTDAKGSESTPPATEPPTTPDPGEQSSFQKILPPSYIYTDDEKQKFFHFDMNSPMNPVVDDISSFFDDDAINATTPLIPPEKEQPASWPIDVFSIFVGASIVLFVATAVKNCQKRKEYTQVPSN